MSFVCLDDAKATLGECPVWSVREQVLYWVDIKGRRIHRFDPEQGRGDSVPVHEDIGCLGLREGGGFIAGMRSGLWHLDGAGQIVAKLADNPEDWQTSRFNDGRCDPAGRFWAGTLDEPKAGAMAHLYRYDGRGLIALEGGLTTSNGLAFSPDGRWLYHSDTPRFTIYRYPFDARDGSLGTREIFARLDPAAPDRARPDGAACDAEGFYWSVLYEGGRVRRYAPDGRVAAEYILPARCPTMVAFGGPDLRTLFVTTVRGGRPDDELARFPESGGLFAMRVEVPGLPEPEFRP